MSKIIQIFLFFFIIKYQFCRTFFVINTFWKTTFLKFCSVFDGAELWKSLKVKSKEYLSFTDYLAKTTHNLHNWSIYFSKIKLNFFMLANNVKIPIEVVISLFFQFINSMTLLSLWLSCSNYTKWRVPFFSLSYRNRTTTSTYQLYLFPLKYFKRLY